MSTSIRSPRLCFFLHCAQLLSCLFCAFARSLICYCFSHATSQVCVRNGSKLPKPALYMIRYHSFYPWHQAGAYHEFMNDQDREMLRSATCEFSEPFSSSI